MKLVTDPELLKLLESDEVPYTNSFNSVGLKEVTDPAILAQLNADEPRQQNTLDSIANSAPLQFIRGAGDTTQNMLANLVNLVPGVNAPMAKTGEGLAYDVGTIGGHIFNYGLPLGAVTKGATALKEIPAASKAAQSLLGSGVLNTAGRNALAGGLYGGLMNPEERAYGATVEGLLGGAGGGLGAALAKLAPSRLFRGTASPEKLAENLEVSRGTNTSLGEITESPTTKRLYENVLSKIYGGGVEDAMKRSATEVTQKGNDILNSMLGTTKPENVTEAIQKALKGAQREAVQLKRTNYDKLNQMADASGLKVSRENLSKEAAYILDEIKTSPELMREAPSKLISDLQAYSNPENANSLKYSNIFKGKIGDKANEAYLAGNNYEYGIYKRLKDSLQSDIDEAIPKGADNPIRQQYETSQKYYREHIAPLEDPAITKFTREGGDPDLILANFIKTGPNDRQYLLSKLISQLPQLEKSLVPYGYFSKAIKEGELDPLKMRSLYKALGPKQRDVLFSQPELRKSMADYSKLVGMNAEPLTQMVNPKTGQRALDIISPVIAHGAGMGVGYELGGLPGAIAGGALGLGSSALLSRALVKKLTGEGYRTKLVEKMLKKSGKETTKGSDLSAAIAVALGQR